MLPCAAEEAFQDDIANMPSLEQPFRTLLTLGSDPPFPLPGAPFWSDVEIALEVDQSVVPESCAYHFNVIRGLGCRRNGKENASAGSWAMQR